MVTVSSQGPQRARSSAAQIPIAQRLTSAPRPGQPRSNMRRRS